MTGSITSGITGTSEEDTISFFASDPFLIELEPSANITDQVGDPFTGGCAPEAVLPRGRMQVGQRNLNRPARAWRTTAMVYGGHPREYGPGRVNPDRVVGCPIEPRHPMNMSS